MQSVTIPAEYFESLEAVLNLDQNGCEMFVIDAINSYLHLCLAAKSGVEFVAKLPLEQRGFQTRPLKFPFNQVQFEDASLSPYDLAKTSVTWPASRRDSRTVGPAGTRL